MKRIFFPLLLIILVSDVNAQIVINELMASSDSLSNLPDEYGEYDDWVELYNSSSSNFDLGGYHITDDSAEPLKWQIPTGTNVPANGYLIIWTDKDENNGQVPLHTNFKLSSAGETVLLSNSIGAYVDSIAYPAIGTNRAYARIPNGTGSFNDWTPSFGFSNDEVSSVNQLVLKNFLLFPNPASNEINIQFEDLNTNLELEIIDASGRIFLTKSVASNRVNININELAVGSYFLRLTTGNSTLLRPFHKL